MGRSNISTFACITQFATVTSSVLTFILGICHISTQVSESWCEPIDDVVSCVGVLNWNLDEFFVERNGITAWRSVFTLAFDQFLGNWVPILASLLTFSVHLPGSNWNPIGKSWNQYAGWFLFLALFCNFGYAGNLGIIVALFSCLVSLLCLVVEFSGEKTPPTDMDIIMEWEKQAERSHRMNIPVAASIGRLATAIVTGLCIVVGIAHLALSFNQWCDEFIDSVDEEYIDDLDCFGPWLVWVQSDSVNLTFISDSNILWRQNVGLEPQVFLDRFTPLIAGALLTLAHRQDSKFQFLVASWKTTSILFLFISFFALFGYAGNLGVLAGFAAIIAFILHFVISFVVPPTERPFLMLKVQIIKRMIEEGQQTKDIREEIDHSKILTAKPREINEESTGNAHATTDTTDAVHISVGTSQSGSDDESDAGSAYNWKFTNHSSKGHHSSRHRHHHRRHRNESEDSETVALPNISEVDFV